MILALEDNFLSSKATRQARKQAREERKTARIEGKTARIQQRQEHKTERQATRQEKRQERQSVGLEKQKKRMIRVKGKEDVIKARSQSKLSKLFAPIQPETPTPSGGGGGSAPSGGGGGGGSAPSQDFETYDETGYDETPYEETEYEEPEYSEYEEEEYENDMQNEQLSAGVLDTALKGLIGAGKGLIQAYTGGQGVKGLIPQNMTSQQIIQLQNEKQLIQQELNKANNQKIIFGIGGLVVGGAIGFFIAKK
jgi:hypothetical protein